jgi:NADH-quinone oxidoreductase subunit E
LRAGEAPVPTRGATLCSFREMSREIAGFASADRVAAALVGSSVGEPSLAGLRLAAERGEGPPAAPPAGGAPAPAGKDA